MSGLDVYDTDYVMLRRDTNQARGLAEYALAFMAGKIGGELHPDVVERTELFHSDSVFCGISAISEGCNAPKVLREEALADYARSEGGAFLFGNKQRVAVEKAVAANVSAVREWDSNGTVFGYNTKLEKHRAGEFGHSDVYPVVVVACQEAGLDGKVLLRGMILIDEIRGRLAEVFSLKTYKIDHVVYEAIASGIVYGAIRGATVDQIESAIGMIVSHYIPFRCIRAGHQLSDSKGASAAISSEVAILSMRRSMRGFLGPLDIFRNPQCVFQVNQPTGDANLSPFDIVLAHQGRDFSVMSQHFKLGLYEHQSAGALQALINILQASAATLRSVADIKSIKIIAYQPAFGIIGDPAKRNPTTRQSADHSMVFICARLIQKSFGVSLEGLSKSACWQQLILTPADYDDEAIRDPVTRSIMDLIHFAHGGEAYDRRYPEGIPTSVIIEDQTGKQHDSGLIMFPGGHARNEDCDLKAILHNKFRELGKLAVDKVDAAIAQLDNLAGKTSAQVQDLYYFDLKN